MDVAREREHEHGGGARERGGGHNARARARTGQCAFTAPAGIVSTNLRACVAPTVLPASLVRRASRSASCAGVQAVAAAIMKSCVFHNAKL